MQYFISFLLFFLIDRVGVQDDDDDINEDVSWCLLVNWVCMVTMVIEHIITLVHSMLLSLVELPFLFSQGLELPYHHTKGNYLVSKWSILNKK